MSSLPLTEEPSLEAQLGRLRDMANSLLPRHQVEHFLIMWRECQVVQVHCSVSGFVKKLGAELGLDATLTAKLQVKLFEEVLVHRRTGSTLNGRRDIAMKITKIRRVGDDATHVFLGLIAAMDHLVGTRYSRQQSEVRAYLVKQSRTIPVCSVNTGALLSGECAPTELAVSIATETERQLMIHFYYLSLCEAVGPIAADRLLSDAVKVVEQQSTAASYSPRRLL